MSKPKRKDREPFLAYLRTVADQMELRDWAITVNWEPPESSDVLACVFCTYGQKHASIRFSDAFWSKPKDEQRQVIAHELVHCHLSSIEWQYNNLAEHLSPALFSVVWAGIKDQIEFATDAIATAVAPRLPLPEQP